MDPGEKKKKLYLDELKRKKKRKEKKLTLTLIPGGVEKLKDDVVVKLKFVVGSPSKIGPQFPLDAEDNESNMEKFP